MSILSRITSGASTLAKNIHVTQSGVLLGRYSSGAGKAQEITLGSGVTVTGGELTVAPAWSDITGKPTEFTPAAHTHTFSSLTSKPTTLAGYGITDAAASSHTHALSSLTQSGAFSKQVVMWSGGNWVPSAVSYLDLTDVPTAVPLTASKVVANAAARLALNLADAEGFAVVEADTGKSYMLVEGGNPATSGDWTQIGDRDIQWADVGGKPTIPTVDNTTVNTAIAEDPAASREALQIFTKRASQPISLTYAPHGTDYVFSTRGTTTQMGRMRYTTPPWASRRFQLCFAQWVVSVLGARLDSCQVVLRCSIEYPSGTLHPVYFNGSRDAVISPSGLVLSDPLDIEIPASTNYWIRVFATCETGDLYLLKRTHVIQNTGGMVIGNPGAAATATLTQSGGVITGVALSTKGSGYPANTEVDCTITGAGSGASIKAIVSRTGVVDGFRIVAGGTGYSGTPTIAIPGNATGSSGYGGVPVDQTTIGTIADYGSAFGLYGPSAILAIPSGTAGHRSYAVIGDSIGIGYYDTNAGWNGWPRRVFDSTGIPMVNLSFGGASLWRSWNLSGTVAPHLGLAEGCTDAIIALGRNDLTDSRTLEQMQADFTTLATALLGRGMRVHAATVTPGTNSTNTALLGNEAIRTGFNDWLRTLPAGITTCFDIADTTETARNSGYWKTGHYYTDGVHATATAFDAMEAAFSDIEP